MMEKIDSAVYSQVCSVSNECTMEDFGRQHIIGYKQANGYGYFEFTQLEVLETHENVIVMDKVRAYRLEVDKKNLKIGL